MVFGFGLICEKDGIVLRFIVGLGLFFVFNAEMVKQLFWFEVMFRDFVVLILVVFGKGKQLIILGLRVLHISALLL